MSTDLYMGGTSQITPGTFANIYMAPSGTGTLGSTIFLQGGEISGTGASNIQLIGPSNTPQITINGGGQSAFSPLNVTNGGCAIQTISPYTANPGNCNYGINTDNVNVSGLVNANAFYAQNFNYTASDIRFKTNVQPIVDALDAIMKLKPVSYTLKSSGKDSLGVIAQDLEKVYPQLVTQGEGMKAVNYDGLIGPLIGAVQELKEENDQLRQKLQQQEQRQNDLEKEIKALRPAVNP